MADDSDHNVTSDVTDERKVETELAQNDNKGIFVIKYKEFTNTI